jgi:hypothetical protein
MNADRQKQIEQRRAQMPKLYRALYDRAVSGKSRKAAMHGFCIECCGYQIKEVHLCTDLGCCLYPYRPRSRASQGTPESVTEPPEFKKGE